MDSPLESGGTPKRVARWVCPSDRQLALRAKLRTGWSVKSGSFEARFTDFPYTSSSPAHNSSSTASNSLNDEEKARIIEVIRRAEAVDLSEQERVGRLVERLESIKKNVDTVTTARTNARPCGRRCSSGTGCICSCALCGEKFAVLGAGPSLCHDCRKYICQKCGIETSPAYLAATGRSASAAAASANSSATTASSGTSTANSSGTTANPGGTAAGTGETTAGPGGTASGPGGTTSGPGGTAPGRSAAGPSETASSSSKTATGSSKTATGSGEAASGTTETTPASRRSTVASCVTSTANAILQQINLHLRLKPQSTIEKWFLCRICAETREMWKKSGAWFFKGLPKYVLPEKKERSLTSTRPVAWPLAAAKNLEAHDQESSSDDEPTRRMSRIKSPLAVNRDVVVRGDASSAPVAGPSVESRAPHRAARSISSTGDDRRHGAENAAEASDNSSKAHNRRLSSSASTATVRSKSSVASSVQRGRRSTIGDERKAENSTSGSQVHLPSGSSQSINSGSRRESSGTVSKASSSTSVSSQETANHDRLPRMQPLGTTETGWPYGNLEISLRYDRPSQCLQCRILRARGLRPMNVQGMTDAFCKLNILPVTAHRMTKSLRTKTVRQTRDPEFNEQINFYGTTPKDMESGKTLHVLVLQDDRVERDFLGEAKFPLFEVPYCQPRLYNVSLAEHHQVPQEELVWGEDNTNGRGQIQLTLTYSTRRSALLVTVERAINLVSMDNNGFSDPFVKLCLAKEPPETKDSARNDRRYGSFGQLLIGNFGVRCLRRLAKKAAAAARRNKCNLLSTSVRWKTLNPVWNEEFVFETRLTDLEDLALLIWVWDKDYGRSNDYLGGLALSCNSKGERLRHWIDAITYPDRSHQGTHNLIGDLIIAD